MFLEMWIPTAEETDISQDQTRLEALVTKTRKDLRNMIQLQPGRNVLIYS